MPSVFRSPITYISSAGGQCFRTISPFLLVGRSGLRSFRGTVIGQPLYLVLVLCCFCGICDILTFTFVVKLSIVYAFGLKHNKRKSKSDL